MSTTAVRENCTITVRLQIEFVNMSAVPLPVFAAAVKTWSDAIDAMWNDTWGGRPGGVRWRGCAVVFEVDTRVGANTAGYHQIRIHLAGDLPGGTTRSTTDIGLLGLTGDWEITESHVVAAHEAGHMLSLDDEYVIDGSGSALDDHQTPPYQASDARCIMANTGTTDVTQWPEHIETAMSALEMHCPFQCYVIHPRRALLEMLVMLKRGPPPAAPQRRRAPGLPRNAAAAFQMVERGRPNARAIAANHVSRQANYDTDQVVPELSSRVAARRWLAAIALGRDDSPAARVALVGALGDESPSVRTAAAHSLLRLGDDRGYPVLLDLLEGEHTIMRHPPTLARDYANRILERYSGHDMGFDPFAVAAERAAGVAAWHAWHDAR